MKQKILFVVGLVGEILGALLSAGCVVLIVLAHVAVDKASSPQGRELLLVFGGMTLITLAGPMWILGRKIRLYRPVTAASTRKL